jgi:hypothetical protein
MTDAVVVLSLFAGFTAVIVAGARLGAGSLGSLAGLFAPQGGRDWPTGVQEADAPRFVFAAAPPPIPIAGSEHAHRLRAEFPAVDRDASTPVPEFLELYSGPIRN